MPTLFDMPRDQMDGYRGTQPVAEDFDAYWSAALADLAAVDPDPRTTPAEFTAPFARCSDLWFTGTHGARLHARLVEPADAQAMPGPAVLMFHGLSGRAPDWTAMLGFAAAGLTVAALDCRGQGGRSEDPGGVSGWTLRGHLLRGLVDDPAMAYYRQVFLDTRQLAGVVMAMATVDATRVGTSGGSQGGGLALACAALEPRIARAAAVFPYLCDYRRVWDLELASGAYADIEDWFRRFDPLHTRRDEVFGKLGYIDVANLTPRIHAEVLMSVGHADRTCPPSTQFAAYNKIDSPKSLREYPDFGHENLPENDDAVFTFLLGL